MSLKAKIEAVLYLTDKPLRAQAIAGIVGEELQLVRQTLLDLIHEYEERQGGLEIADEDGYSFQVRDQFSNLMDEFLPIEMTAAQLRTLSAIAIKQPISQSEIIRIRGQGAYDHIKELVMRGLVHKREDEKIRSPLLSTTKQFQEYFRLSKDGKSLRQYLKREMKKKDKEELAGTAPELEKMPLEAGMPLAAGDLTENEPIFAAEDQGSVINNIEMAFEIQAQEPAEETISFAPDSTVNMEESFEPDNNEVQLQSKAPEEATLPSAAANSEVLDSNVESLS